MEKSRFYSGAATLIMVVAAGCGSGSSLEPELAAVSGKITVNGVPGSDLDVVFEPQAAGPGTGKDIGAASMARTDAEGNYKLLYKGTMRGAVVGKHVVRIVATAGGGPAGGETGAVAKFDIPPAYGADSALVREVQKGENTIDVEVKLN